MSDTDDEVQGELADFADPERLVEPRLPWPDPVPDEPESAYDPSDPKHPTYHERMSGLWDNRDKFA
jgi:hypothetical protein